MSANSRDVLTPADDAQMMVDDKPPGYFWLSFCDPARPVGEKSLGCTVVAASNHDDALRAAWRLGMNPGGEVQAIGIVDDGTVNPDLLAFMLNTLRSRVEMEAVGAVRLMSD